MIDNILAIYIAVVCGVISLLYGVGYAYWRPRYTIILTFISTIFLTTIASRYDDWLNLFISSIALTLLAICFLESGLRVGRKIIGVRTVVVPQTGLTMDQIAKLADTTEKESLYTIEISPTNDGFIARCQYFLPSGTGQTKNEALGDFFAKNLVQFDAKVDLVEER